MTKITDIPAIRFKGFSDTWEQRKLGDNIIEYTETTTKNNQYPPLTSSRKGIFLQTEYFAGNQIASDDNTGYNIVPYGYFTYRHMSDDEIFHFNINDIVENGIVSTLYPVFTTDENLDSRYLQYQLNYGYEFAKFAILQKQGGSRTYMYLNKLKQLYLTMPKSVEEQNAISAFFMSLDNLITLHQRKYDKLTNVKKSMLEKMFPQNGSNAPEIRFKGFTEAWEQRKFGEVFDCTVPNNTLSRAELSYDEGTVLNVHYGDVLIKYGSVLDVQKDDIPRIPHRCREDFNGALLQDGDVIIADTAEDETTGKACEIGNLQGSAIVSGLHTMVCRPRNRMALGYLGYYLNSNAYHYQLLPLMQGIKVLSLSRSNIQKTSVSYPSAMKEQQLIASYFSQLDHLITLHQRELEKLKNLKKACLEKMFV